MPTGAAALLTALLAFSGLEQTLRVVPLPRDGEVLVSFQLAQTLTPELRTAIASGSRTRGSHAASRIGKANFGGMTPITVRAVPLALIDLPTMSGELR